MAFCGVSKAAVFAGGGALFATIGGRHIMEARMIFSRRLRSQEHIKEFVVDEADDRGWEVREEEDHRIVKRTWMRDWHRVENAMMRFGLEATQLQRAGWVEVSNMV
jgi:hypothetical protein